MNKDLELLKKLIIEFTDFKIQGEKPYFNFRLNNGLLTSYTDIPSFYDAFFKLDYKEAYVTPF